MTVESGLAACEGRHHGGLPMWQISLRRLQWSWTQYCGAPVVLPAFLVQVADVGLRNLCILACVFCTGDFVAIVFPKRRHACPQFSRLLATCGAFAKAQPVAVVVPVPKTLALPRQSQVLKALKVPVPK